LIFVNNAAPVVAIILTTIDYLLRVLAVIFIPPGRKPQTTTAWLIAIFAVPTLGWLAFALFGSNKLPRKRRRKQREINQYILDTTGGVDRVSMNAAWPNWLAPIVALNRKLGAMPMVGGNTARMLTDYTATLQEMTDAVGTASRFVHVEFYILVFDRSTAPFFAALEAAVQRGVTVRVLLDHVASVRAPRHKRTIRQLKRIGVRWDFMLPIQPWRGRYQRVDLRNHRKILVIDGTVAYTGSQNLVDASYNKRANIRRGLVWRDLMVRFEGPIVAGINALFVTDWYTETNELLLRETEAVERTVAPDLLDAQVVPSGPGFEGENNLRLFNALVYNATEKVMITSPYFVPDDSMLYAITSAAQGGLDVQLFVSEVADQPVVYHAQRSYYEALLRAGVRIWLYPAPTVLHAKHLTIDDQVAVIGSSNMDMRSFSLNLEISVMVRGETFVNQLRSIEDGYRAVSRELTLDEWLTQPRRSRVLDNVARITATVQ
jgi:cardiolipin synthase